MKSLARDRSLLTATVVRGRRVTLRHNSEGFSEEEIARRYRWSLDQELQYWSGSIPSASTLDAQPEDGPRTHERPRRPPAWPTMALRSLSGNQSQERETGREARTAAQKTNSV